MAVTSNTLRLLDGLRRQLAAITDQQTRDLTAAWITAWDEVSADLNDALIDLLASSRDGTVTRTAILRSRRLLNALAVIHDQLEILARSAGLRISADLQTVIDDAGRAQTRIIDSQLPNFEQGRLDGWDRVDARQIAAIVQRSTERITHDMDRLPPRAAASIRAELIRGIAAGANPRETARRIVTNAEGRFNGSLSLTRALVIARTETLDAHRSAAALAMAAEADTLSGWIWQATLDTRTCPSCWAHSGELHDLADPGPLDHQQGRCARLPKTKSWAELGFEGIDEPPDLMPDSQARFDNLSAEEQRQILGRKGYEAWLAGDYPMEAWSQRRTTAGWRDSYQVAPPPSGGRLGRRLAS